MLIWLPMLLSLDLLESFSWKVWCLIRVSSQSVLGLDLDTEVLFDHLAILVIEFEVLSRGLLFLDALLLFTVLSIVRIVFIFLFFIVNEVIHLSNRSTTRVKALQ